MRQEKDSAGIIYDKGDLHKKVLVVAPYPDDEGITGSRYSVDDIRDEFTGENLYFDAKKNP